MKRKVFNLCAAVLLSVCFLALGVGVLVGVPDTRAAYAAVETGRADAPFVIAEMADFERHESNMASPGTVASPKYFVITKDIDMNGFQRAIPTLADNCILYGKKEGAAAGADDSIALSNLNSSLFDNVTGSDSVIKNIKFAGSGNMARNFSGTMDNVHHTAGTIMAAAPSAGGLVNYSYDATFRYCSNAATVKKSTVSIEANGGIIGWARGNLQMTQAVNTGEISVIGGVEVTGGLVGKITTDGLAVIEFSHNEGGGASPSTGKVAGMRSGGILGKAEGAGEVRILESYNSGEVANTTSGGTQPHAAGILAWAVGAELDVLIMNCYNTGTVQNGTNNSGTYAHSGIFSTNEGAAVRIFNTYNVGRTRTAISRAAGVTMENNYALSGISYSTGGLGGGTVSRTDAEMKAAAFVAELNNGPDPIGRGTAFMTKAANSYPVIVALNTVSYTFDINGGELDGVESVRRFNSYAEISAARAQMAELESDLQYMGRAGFDFAGWSTNAQDISGTKFADLVFNQAISENYYAIWTAKRYEVSLVNSDDADSYQNYELADEFGNPIARDINPSAYFVVIGQKIRVITYLTGSHSTMFFDHWEILGADGSAGDGGWVALDGERPIIGPENNSTRVLEEHIYLYEDEVSAIDAGFLADFAAGGKISIRAVYKNGGTKRITVNAATQTDGVSATLCQSWGTILLDGVEKRTETFTSQKSFVIAAKPINEYYSFEGFSISTDADGNGTYTSVGATAGTGNYAGYFTYTADVSSDFFYVRARFEPVEYRITVTPFHDDGTEDGVEITDPDTVAALVFTPPVLEPVSLAPLSDEFGDVKLNSTSQYDLIDYIDNNVKIWNYTTAAYDFFPANNGDVYFPITELFLRDYVRPDAAPTDPDYRTIAVHAIYMKQISIELHIPFAEGTDPFGTVNVSVYGRQETLYEEITDLNQTFDYGSDVVIDILPEPNAKVSSVTGLEDITNNNNSYQFKLVESPAAPDANRTIDIEFVANSFTLNVVATDSNRNTNPEFTLPADKIGISVEKDLGGEWIKGGDVERGDSISIEITDKASYENDWRFEGWYLILDGEEFLISDGDLIDGDALEIVENNEIFSLATERSVAQGGFSQALRDENGTVLDILIEARFAKIFLVEIAIASADSGTVTGAEVGTHRYAAGEVLTLKLNPANYFSFDGIDGLTDAERAGINFDARTVTVTVDGERHLSVNFLPERKTIIRDDKISHGNVSLNAENLAIGDRIVLHFAAQAGFNRSDWKINDIAVDGIANATVNGDTVTLEITRDWYSIHGAKILLDISAEMNPLIITGIILLGLFVPALTVGIIFAVRANKKHKAEYAAALVKMKEAKARLGYADMIKNLRGDE